LLNVREGGVHGEFVGSSCGLNSGDLPFGDDLSAVGGQHHHERADRTGGGRFSQYEYQISNIQFVDRIAPG